MKPGIIVLSHDDEDAFRWVSTGWNNAARSHTKKAKELMRRAHLAIQSGRDRDDVINKLETDGFEVTIQED